MRFPAKLWLELLPSGALRPSALGVGVNIVHRIVMAATKGHGGPGTCSSSTRPILERYIDIGSDASGRATSRVLAPTPHAACQMEGSSLTGRPAVTIEGLLEI